MKWIYLLIAGALEITWAVAMKMSNGFTVLIPSIVTGVGYIASAVFLAIALKQCKRLVLPRRVRIKASFRMPDIQHMEHFTPFYIAHASRVALLHGANCSSSSSDQSALGRHSRRYSRYFSGSMSLAFAVSINE